MIDVTVPVPESRVKEFYTRFVDFLDGSAPAEPRGYHAAGAAPAWVSEPGAKERASSWWYDVTDAGRQLLRILMTGADEHRKYSPEELARQTDAKSVQSIAGIFGGIGQTIATHGLPRYEYASGKAWHFIWDWDPKKRLYSMSPEMAHLLLQAAGA